MDDDTKWFTVMLVIAIIVGGILAWQRSQHEHEKEMLKLKQVTEELIDGT